MLPWQLNPRIAMRLLKLFTRLHTNVLRDLFHSTDDDYTCIYYNTFNSQNNCCQTNFSSGKLSIVGKIPYKSKTKCRASFFFFSGQKKITYEIYIFSLRFFMSTITLDCGFFGLPIFSSDKTFSSIE